MAIIKQLLLASVATADRGLNMFDNLTGSLTDGLTSLTGNSAASLCSPFVKGGIQVALTGLENELNGFKVVDFWKKASEIACDEAPEKSGRTNGEAPAKSAEDKGIEILALSTRTLLPSGALELIKRAMRALLGETQSDGSIVRWAELLQDSLSGNKEQKAILPIQQFVKLLVAAESDFESKIATLAGKDSSDVVKEFIQLIDEGLGNDTCVDDSVNSRFKNVLTTISQSVFVQIETAVKHIMGTDNETEDKEVKAFTDATRGLFLKVAGQVKAASFKC